MNTSDEKCAEQPVYERANDTLDAIHRDLTIRVQTIDGEMNRLHGERESILYVLSRISPPTPQPAQTAAVSAYGGNAVKPSPRCW